MPKCVRIGVGTTGDLPYLTHLDQDFCSKLMTFMNSKSNWTFSSYNQSALAEDEEEEFDDDEEEEKEDD